MRTDVKQLNYLHFKLRKIIVWLEKTTGLEFTETSSYRIDDNDVHGTEPCRGYDLRMRHVAIGEAICNHINTIWIYDTERPDKKCAVLHGKGSNLHIHLQVHPNTALV